ncbi:hypothetical protein [Hymenobacter algoricola]|uniref:Uncharacterized protein n=1 Tax=Hymenobacter algoricola TaxID=486267 RepID=A0ABP7MJN1_9BACT
MKIYLSPRTVGISGGGLKGNLQYLDRLIQSELDKSNFQSSFNELWLSLSYPAMYVVPDIVGMEITFNKYYETFPYSRMNRKFKTIDINLKAPEFSEHFQKEEQINYKDKFEIADEYKNIDEPELANVLIDKYFEALQIIKSKLKKDDLFDFETFENVLINIRQKISLEFLITTSKQENISLQKFQIENSEIKRQERKDRKLTSDTLIRDIRLLFDYKLPRTLFYLNRYADIVLRQLIQKDFKCPHYHHLYISIADTKEEALKRAIVVEDWFAYGIAVLKEDILLKADHSEQQALVLNALKEGLIDIAELDKLDEEKVLAAISEAKEIGVLSEIIYKAKENNKITFTISTKTILGQNEEEIYFTIVDKETDKIAKWKFGQENIFLIGGWFGTINVANKKITIKPRANMDLVLEGKQKIIEIDVEKELADMTKIT